MENHYCIGGTDLLERTVSLEIDKAYADLKKVFLAKDSKLISGKSPNQIVIKQGSLWGISPVSAKKTVKATLTGVNSATKVTCTTQLSSDWKNITIIGCVFAAILAVICLWITFDLNTFIVTHRVSFWSWLITINGTTDFQVGAAFVGFTKSLALFLSVIIAVEVAIFVYVKAKLDGFARDVSIVLLADFSLSFSRMFHSTRQKICYSRHNKCRICCFQSRILTPAMESSSSLYPYQHLLFASSIVFFDYRLGSLLFCVFADIIVTAMAAPIAIMITVKTKGSFEIKSSDIGAIGTALGPSAPRVGVGLLVVLGSIVGLGWP